jgi:hypothetical protein
LTEAEMANASLLNRLKEEIDIGLKGCIYNLTKIKLSYKSCYAKARFWVLIQSS